MDIFFELLTNLIPLYILIALGWVAGRYFDVDRVSLGSLGIYIFMPVVAFYYLSELDFKPAYIALPVIVCALYSGLTILFFWIGQKLYPDKRANLLSMCCGASNIGYFGLPIIIMLFPPEWVGVYIFALTGGVVYEATLMYYIANRGNFSPKESFIRVLKFPTIYSVLLGLIVNFSGFELPAQLDPFWEYFQGSYIVIGMMIIGVSLSSMSRLKISPKFIGVTFFAQFLIWPALVLMIIGLDKAVLHWFEPEVHKMLFIMSICPPAANITAFAATLDLNPEKAATTVLAGTVFALFFIPAVLVLSGLH